MPNKRNNPPKAGKSSTSPKLRFLTLPTLAYVATGQSSKISFQTFITGCESTFKGLPWRLFKCKFEVVVQTTTASSGLTPAVVQISFCDAKSTNVEAITSIRFLALSSQKTTRHMKMKSPNPWKEDEEAGQACIVIDNIDTKAQMKTSIMVYLTATFQLGPMRFDATSALPITASIPSSSVWNTEAQTISCTTTEDPSPTSSLECMNTPLDLRD